MRSVCAAFLTLLAFTAAAQPIDQGPLIANVEPEVELPPRYRIEFILFAHNRFDANEEHFDIVPHDSQFAPSDEPLRRRFFDEDSRQALRALIDTPIIEPLQETALEDPGPLTGEGAFPADAIDPDAIDQIDDSALEQEAFLDPRMVEGPNTRYLDISELALLPTLDRLDRLDAYTPLVHAGWEQNGLSEADAVALDLAEFASTNPRGTLRLHMSRYLHMAIDLAYRNEPPAQDEEAIPAFGDFQPVPPARAQARFPELLPFAEAAEPEYYLLEQRRILRGELNYFDHPAFGLLLQITLAPEPETESETQTNGPSA